MSQVALAPHPQARHQAIAKAQFAAGSLIISTPCFASTLFAAEKGRRCDYCLVLGSLRRCSSCTSYWYCDATCQSLDWQMRHKHICKYYNQFTASGLYQALAPHERLDAELLSHLAARISPLSDDNSPAYGAFMSLLPGPMTTEFTPPVCGKSKISQEQLYAMYSRFGNNNFVVHSHLSGLAHGIFPLASQYFNHSCLPNAAARYILRRGQVVQMEVFALRDISLGEQICIPYLDPALLQQRTRILELSYGFTCDCKSCTFLSSIVIPPLPQGSEVRAELAKALHVFIAQSLPGPLLLETALIPPDIYPAFNESYLSSLSEQFSSLSHDGPYSKALEIGETLLDLYKLIYPPNYPQIGMHLLELAKTAWNDIASQDVVDPKKKGKFIDLVNAADRVLQIMGLEGDAGGPSSEIQTLKECISSL